MRNYLEEERLHHIRKILGKGSKRVHQAVGKRYCLTAFPKGKMLSVTANLVEGVHFSLNQMNPWEFGHKALAIALSRAAATGAKPESAIVSLGIRQDSSLPFVREFYRGMKQLATQYKVDLLGAHTVDSPNFLFANVTLISQPGSTVIDNEGARKGDVLALTGGLGNAIAGMICLKQLGRTKLYNHNLIVERYLTPTPPMKAAEALLKTDGVTSMIAIESSLSADLYEITEASRVGALVIEKDVPIAKEAVAAARLVDANPIRWAFYGAEDFELLVTMKPEAFKKAKAALKRRKMNLYQIGEIKGASYGVKVERVDGKRVVLEPREWHPLVRRQSA